MNEQIDTEVNFYVRNIGKDLGGTEQSKIMSIVTKITTCSEYMEKVNEAFKPVTEHENFNLTTDLTELIKILIVLNQGCDFYKIIVPERMQYIIYGVIYASLLKNNNDIINNIDPSDFRLIYSNAMELILLPSEKLRMEKQDCINCISRTFKWLSWLENKLNIK